MYKPLPSQKKFHDSKAHYKCLMGPVGSGKTTALCYEALRCAEKYPGKWGALLIGHPPGSPRDYFIGELRRSFAEVLEAEKILFKAKSNELHFPNPPEGSGSHVRFELATWDRFDRYARSWNLAWLGFDLTYEKDPGMWDLFRSRLRAGQEQSGFAVCPEEIDWVRWAISYDDYSDPTEAELIITPSGENIYLPTEMQEASTRLEKEK